MLTFPVSDYMIVGQLEGQGLVSIGVPMQTSRYVNGERITRLGDR